MESASSHFDELLRQGGGAVCIEPEARIRWAGPPPPALLPGSFNPLHQAHLRLAEVAADLIGQPVAFELSLVNVDKPPLDPAEVQRRSQQFARKAPLWLTKASTFLQKAELFPNTIFVVGADTAQRIVSAQYYLGDDARMTAALERIRLRGCRFLVAGRAAGVRFLTLADLELPPRHDDLFTAIPADRFRLDLSSTDLRSSV
jgi:hypothetical protein